MTWVSFAMGFLCHWFSLPLLTCFACGPQKTHLITSNTVINCGFIRLVNQLYADRQTDSQPDGVSLQMCIPAARGVMEPLNEAQQECKQKGLSVGARGRPRVGREEEDQQRKWLSSSSFSLLCSQRVRGHAGCRLLELETVGKSRRAAC